MAMAFDLLRKAKDKIVETVQVGLGTAPASDDEFQAYKKRLDRLSEMINVLRQNFQKYAETVVMMQKAACIVAKDVANFYKQSAPRQKTVQDFTDAHVTMESTVFDVFKNEFGWEILQAFDDWLSDIAKMRSNVKIAEETRQKVLSLGAKVKASEQRGDPDLGDSREKLSQMAKKFATMQTSLESGVAKMIEGRFASFDKMFVRLMECQVDFFRAGNKVAENLQPHVENFRTRFPRSSKGDYRPPTVPKPDSEDPHPNGDVNGDHVSDSGSDSDDHNLDAAQNKAEDEPPAPKRNLPKPPPAKPAAATPSAAPSSGRKPDPAKPAGLAGGAAASSAARSATPPVSDNAGPVGGLDLFNGSELKKSNSQQFAKPAKGANADFFQSMSQVDVDLMDGPSVAQTGSYVAPSMDFFSSEPSPSSLSQKSAGRSSSPTPSKGSAIDPFDALNSFGAPAASPANSFAGSSRPAPINAYGSKLPGNLQPPLRSSSGGNPPASSSQGARPTSSASSSPKPLADDFGAFRSPQAPVSPSPASGRNMGFDDLDPFAKSTGPSPAPVAPVEPKTAPSSRATSSARRSAAPSPMPAGDGPVVVGGDASTDWDGNAQPGEITFKSAPNIKKKSAEEEAEEEEEYQRTKRPGQTKTEWLVEKNVREHQQQRAEQAAKEQKDRDSEQEALMRLEDRLKAWELKNGVQRNLRNLLSSVHTILWPGIEWSPLSIADLTDASRVRKAYFKVVRVIHPDKLPLTASADQKVIAKKAYEAIQSAWKKFEEEGHA